MFVESRGIHHIKRLLGAHENLYCIISAEKYGKFQIGKFVQQENGNVYLINSVIGCLIESQEERFEELKEERASFCKRFGICNTNITIIETLKDFYAKFFLFDDKELSEYESFMACNKKKFSKFVSKFETIYNADLMLFAMMCKKPNTLFWLINNIYCNSVSRDYILSVYKLFSCCEKYASRWLSRGTITAYNEEKEIFQLEKELLSIRFDKRVANSINEFNTAQKKLLREAHLSKEDKVMLNKFSMLSDEKRKNFIRKCSTIDDISELIRLLGVVTNKHFDWNKESLKEYLSANELFNYEIAFENDDFVIVKVGDFNTVKNVAKTTNWCISKSRSYWDQYSSGEKNSQYVAFDFSKEEDSPSSIVGFTIFDNKKITYAHDFNNKNIIKSEKVFPSISTFYSKERMGIKNYLKEHNAPNEFLFQGNNECPFDWDIESAFNFFMKNENEVFNVIFKNDDVIAIRCNESLLLKTFFGASLDAFADEDYEERLESKFLEKNCIAIFDFSLSSDDEDSILCFELHNNKTRCYEYCARCFNRYLDFLSDETFDIKLLELGMPYDTICRPGNKNIAKKVIGDCDLTVSRWLIASIIKSLRNRNKDVINTMNKEFFDNWFRLICYSLTDFMTLDLLNEIVKEDGFDALFGEKNFITTIQNLATMVGVTPSDEELNGFRETQHSDNHVIATYCGLMSAVEKLIATANPQSVKNLVMSIGMLDMDSCVKERIINISYPYENSARKPTGFSRGMSCALSH